jgi:hypothetical protein
MDDWGSFLGRFIIYFPFANPSRYGASSGCGWRRRPPNMEGNCECIE